MLLQKKTAILYGAGGHIGRAVAQAFAREGAQLFLTGRETKPVKWAYSKRALARVTDEIVLKIASELGVTTRVYSFEFQKKRCYFKWLSLGGLGGVKWGSMDARAVVILPHIASDQSPAAPCADHPPLQGRAGRITRRLTGWASAMTAF